MSISSLSAKPTLPAMDEIRLSLERMLPPLADFGRREEAQFVSIGQDLADFLRRARSISSDSEEVLDSLLRKEGDDVLAALGALMDGLDRHIVQLLAAARTHEESLRQVAVHINRIEAPLQSLAKVVKILHSLSFSTKVESTQGHSVVVLQALADDLKGLATKINAKTDALRERLKLMSSLAQGAREKTQTMAELSLRQAASNLQHCRGLIGGVAGRRTAALADAQLLKDYSSTISSALAEVISSVQYHDITRQQVDHVQTALHEFCGRFQDDDVAEQLAIEIADLCRIQSAQLRHTRHDLVSAVVRMIGNLHSIAPAVAQLAKKTRNLSTSTEETGSNFFRDIEPVLTIVTRIIVEADQEECQAKSAVAAVLGALNELSQLLQEVESIGTEMKMISLNAGITAAHNLERGAGLGVIARSIQNLSGEVLSRTHEFATVYGEMERLARELDLDATAPLRQDSDRSIALNEESKIFMARLQSMNQGVVALLMNLDREALSLAADVVASAGKITIHIEAGKIIDGLLVELEAVASTVHGAIAPDGAPKILDRLSRNYTMQSERKVHSEARHSEAAAASAPGGARPIGKDLTGLGENVELF